MFPWRYRTIHSGDVLPRQFEYHPNYQDVILYGTQDAKVGVLSTESGTVTPLGVFGKDSYDPILGLCWFRKESSKFVVGSSCGHLKCAEFSLDRDPDTMPMTHSYSPFPHLSSVHINSEDTHLLVSGTSRDIAVYDLKTGQKTHEMKRIHSDSINISRFSNHSPNLLATCSFDAAIKLWDLRQGQGQGPVQTMATEKAIVMINFSPSDALILSAGADNEVHQFLVANGQKDLSYDVPKRHSSVNFTRAYYSRSGAFVATGGSEEDCLHIMSSSTGAMICNVPLFPGTYFPSLYVQSLRLCPQNDNLITALVNDRVLGQRQLVHIEVTSSMLPDDDSAALKGSVLCNSSDPDRLRPPYALAAVDACRADVLAAEHAGSGDDEAVAVRSLLPPTDHYINTLDKLWFKCVSGSELSASAKDGWRDGVVYLTSNLATGAASAVPRLYGGPQWCVCCTCRGKQEWMQQFAVCIPVHPVLICARNPTLGALIQSSIAAAIECREAINQGHSDSSCALGGVCRSDVLAVSMDSIMQFLNVQEALLFGNCIIRYFYSSTISIDALIKIAMGADNLKMLLDESYDSGSLPVDVWKRDRDCNLEQLVGAITTIYSLAVPLGASELLSHVDCIMTSLLRVHMLLKIMGIAVHYERNELIEACTRFLGANFEVIYANSKFGLSDDRSIDTNRKIMAYDFLKAVQLSSANILRNGHFCVEVSEVPGIGSGSVSFRHPSVERWIGILTDMCRLFEPSVSDSTVSPIQAVPDATISTEGSRRNIASIVLGVLESIVNGADSHSEGEDAAGGSAMSSSSNDDNSDSYDDNSTVNSDDMSAQSMEVAASDITNGDDDVIPFSVAVRAARSFRGRNGEEISPSSGGVVGGFSSIYGPDSVKVEIPFVFGHSSVFVLDEMVLHFGGRNNYTMFGNDMLLAYYPAQCKWKYIQTFGTMPPMLNATIALPLQAERTTHVLFVDDKYGKWNFFILDCRNMMWTQVKMDTDRVGLLCHRHRATIAAVTTHEREDDSCHTSNCSHLVVWGGYCFDTQRSKNDVLVATFSPARTETSVPLGATEDASGGETKSDMEVEDVGDDGSERGVMRGQRETTMPLSGLKSTCANMMLPQISRLVDAMTAPGTVELKCTTPIIAGRPPPPRWGTSSALMYVPSGVRMIVHGGVGQIGGTMEDEVFSLRCANPADMQWELAHTTGWGPGTRYGHTMTSSSAGTILLYGGCFLNTSTWQFQEAEDDSIFCLEYVSSDFNSISLRWSVLCPIGAIDAPLRMKHTAIVWNKSYSVEQLIIFGGVKQSGGINGDSCVSENGVRRYDVIDRTASALPNFDQSIIFVNGSPRPTRSHYCIHECFQGLMSTGLLSDLSIRLLLPPQDGAVDEIGASDATTLSAHSVLVGLHVTSLSSSIGWARDVSDHSSDHKVVYLDPDVCCDPAVVKQFIEYLYSGIPDLNPSNVLQMAAIADLYVIDTLYRHCEGFLLHFVRKNNACEMLSCTDDSFVFSKMTLFRTTALNIIASNFDEVKDTPEFMSLSEDSKRDIAILKEKYLIR